MIRPQDRKIAALLVSLKLWKVQPNSLWRIPEVIPCWGTRWLKELMLERQTRDGFHHAPMCPGNDWSGMYLVLWRCTCGAVKHDVRSAYPPTPYRSKRLTLIHRLVP